MWRCPKCGESIGDGFDACWKCGTAQDGTVAPGFQAEPNDPAVPDPGASAEESGAAAGDSSPARPRSTWTDAEIATRAQFMLRILGVYLVIAYGARLLAAFAMMIQYWLQWGLSWSEWKPTSPAQLAVLCSEFLPLLAGFYLLTGGKWVIEKVFLPAPSRESEPPEDRSP
jgi:hypothetical protein